MCIGSPSNIGSTAGLHMLLHHHIDIDIILLTSSDSAMSIIVCLLLLLCQYTIPMQGLDNICTMIVITAVKDFLWLCCGECRWRVEMLCVIFQVPGVSSKVPK